MHPHPTHVLLPSITPDSTIHLQLGTTTYPIHTTLLSAIPWFNNHLPATPPTFKPITRITPLNIGVTVRLPPPPPRTMTIPTEWGVREPEMDAFVRWLYLRSLRDIGAEVAVRLWVLAARVGEKQCMDSCVVVVEGERRARGMVYTGLLSWVWRVTGGEEGDERDSAIEVVGEDTALKTGCGADSLWDGKWVGRECPLRRLLVDQCAWRLHHDWLRSHEEQFPREFLLDLTFRLREIVTDGIVAPFEAAIESYFVAEMS